MEAMWSRFLPPLLKAKEAMECVKAGKLESEVVPHSLSIGSCEMYDLIIK